MNSPSSAAISSLSPKPPTEGTLRIRRISRYLKAMILFYFVVMPMYVIILWLFGHGRWTVHFSDGTASLSAAEKLIDVISSFVYLAMAVNGYRLLNLFEKGVFFQPSNVRLLRCLGYLIFSNGLLGLVAPVAASRSFAFPGILLAAIASPGVVGGLFAIMVSHIMEEGCKLREEQELTV